jgi:hypothetical protein
MVEKILNNKLFCNRIRIGLITVSCSLLFVQNAYAHLPPIDDFIYVPFIGIAIGSIVGVFLTKRNYIGAIIGALIGHFIITTAIVVILNAGDFVLFVVLLLGLIPALISGAFIGFVAKGIRTPQH